MENQNEQQQKKEPPAEAKPVMNFDKKDIDENKIIAALSYLGLLCLIPLLAKKDSKFAQEHGKQGLVLLIAWMVIWVIGIVPILGWIVSFIGSIILLIVNLIAIVKTLMGDFWEIPVLGQYRHQFKL